MAQPIPGAHSDRLCTWAAEYGLYVCAGLTERDGGKLYNTAVLIDKRGKLLGKHRKINLLTEIEGSGLYSVGSKLEVFDTELGKLGCAQVVLTGVSLEPGRLGVMAYDTQNKTFFEYDNEKMPSNFHGTGDVFASVMVGAMMRGCSLADALRLAVDFTLESIRKTVADPEHRWYGVNFEEAIPLLVSRLSHEPHPYNH